jgi:hypothetical protein
MEQSELTTMRIKQIMSGGRTVVQRISNQIDSAWQVLGLGCVNLAIESIISLARPTKS